MSKHTPGPWVYDGDCIWSEPSKCYVANPQTEDMLSGEIIARRDARQQIEANARLIAAAPDMLAALRMVGMLRKLGGMMPGSHEVVQMAVDAADAAISKAEAAK